VIALAAFDAREIDPFEEHDEVRGADLDPWLGLGRWRKAKASGFQSLDAGITMPSFLWRYTNSVQSDSSGP
jgi:hypothetical protein